MDIPHPPAYTRPMTPAPAVRFLDRTTPPHISTLILLAGLSALSMNIFLPSLPSIAAWYDADYALVQLSVSLFLGINAILQLFIGPISDRYGRRPVILTGIVIYLVMTVACMVAPTIEIFLACRMGQAVIVVAMVLSRAIVRDMVPQDQAASMIGYVTMGMALVPMVGPAIGGALDTWFGWQASFVFLFVAGIALFWMTWRDLGETNKNPSSSFRQQASQYPELLTSRRFWGYCLAAALGSGAFFAYLGGAPYVGANIFGLDPATLGFFFGAPAIGYATGNFISGRYSARFGVNSMVLWGSIAATVGLGMSLAVDIAGHSTIWTFFGFMTTVGFGNGMVIPNATAGMLSVRPQLAGTASGLGGAIIIGGGAALSAVAGTVLEGAPTPGPLIGLMFGSCALGVASIAYTIRRDAQVRNT